MGEFSGYDLAASTGSAVPIEVERKTVKKDDAAKQNTNAYQKKTFVASGKKNVLDTYRSYTYNFTLSALRTDVVNNPKAYRESELELVILKSGGKGESAVMSLNALSAAQTKNSETLSSSGENYDTRFIREVNKNKASTTLVNNNAMISGFNQRSPGRFDLFIDNVKIENTMAFSKESNVTLPTNVEFEVFEPYSINGFIEALHVSAVAAGYPNYVQASFLLKVEFVGYPDSDNDMFKDPEPIKDSVRYFPIKFTGLAVEVTERGTKYRCTAVPFNQVGYGQPNKVKKPIKMTGKKVKEILENFIDAINEQVKGNDKDGKPNQSSVKSDIYRIKFPERTDTGLNFEKDNLIAGYDVVTLLKDNAAYKFPDPATAKKDTRSPEEKSKNPENVRFVPDKVAVHFNEGQNIHDIISTVIRDSEFGRNIVKLLEQNPTKPFIDEFGFIDYFMINLQVENQNEIDETTRKPFQIFTFVVMPYKVHYTTVPGYKALKINESLLKTRCQREYNYIYTGLNTDIINFNLNFNTLFFEAMPYAMGNNNTPSLRTGAGNDPNSSPKKNAENMDRLKNTQTPVPKVDVDPSLTGVRNQYGTSGQILDDPYSVLAKSMHNAIVDAKASMITGDIDIIGDPYYLVTGGIGNYNPKIRGPGLTEDGEADCNSGQLLIAINFRNPIDINSLEKGGLMNFDPQRVPFSGVYQVIKATSNFGNGEFKQKLELVRMSGQYLDENSPVDEPSVAFVQQKDPLTEIVKDETNATNSGARPSEANLLLQLGRGLPSSGLPGELSNFTAALGGLGGKVTSVLNQVSGAVTNGIGKLTSAASAFGGSIPGGVEQLASGIRLNASGLTSLVQNTLAPAAIVAQTANTLKNSFSVDNAVTSLAKNVVDQASNLQKLVSVPGSGIGEGASVLLNKADVISASVNQLSGTAVALGNNALSAVKGLGNQASSLVNGVKDKIGALSSINVNDPTALASKFGINPAQLSGLSDNLKSKVLDQVSDIAKNIPANVNLSAAAAQGLVLDYISKNDLKNIPPTAPFVTAPAPEVDKVFLSSLVAAGGATALANAFGVKDISKISSTLLSPDTAKSIVDSVATSISNPLKDKFPLLDKTNLASLGDKLSSAQSQLSSIANVSSNVEANLSAIKSTISSSIDPSSNLSTSVAAQFGSKTVNSSPLVSLVMKRTLLKKETDGV